jgi:hypothetical protein
MLTSPFSCHRLSLQALALSTPDEPSHLVNTMVEVRFDEKGSVLCMFTEEVVLEKSLLAV